MVAREELTSTLKQLVEESGLSLFDIDYPTVASPTLRVFVWKAQASKNEREDRRGVTLDECAVATRAIINWFETEGIGEEWSLEVSSPGINRRLRSREHFVSAIGERVKIKVRSEAEDETAGNKVSVVGQIVEVNDDSVVLSYREGGNEKKKKGKRSPSVGSEKKISFPITAIEEARVDFLFD